MPRLQVGTENGSPIELHYEDYGSGKPVVLIHGWPLSGRSWEFQVPALIGARRRVITYDRRGFGSSSQPWNGYDFDTFVADLDVLVRHLDLKEATLVGFSMGGGEVVRYVAKYGTGRVSKAVLAAAAPPYLCKAQDNPEGPLDEATIAQFQNGVKRDRIAFIDEFTKGFFSSGGKLRVSEQQRIYAREIASFASPKGTLDCIAAFSRTDFRGDLKKIVIPTLIIHGDSDAIIAFEATGKRSHEAIKGSQLALIKGGPHGLNVSHADAFNKALLEFVGR